MKFNQIHIAASLAILAGICACSKQQPDQYGGELTLKDVTFCPTVVSTMTGTRTAMEAEILEDLVFTSETKGTSLDVYCDCYDMVDESCSQLKGTLHNTSEASANLSNYFQSFSVSSWSNLTNGRFIGDENADYKSVVYIPAESGSNVWSLRAEDYSKGFPRWDNRDSKSFFAYANMDNSGFTEMECSSHKCQTMTYTVPAIAANQKDVLLGDYSGITSPDANGNEENPSGVVPLTFRHPLSAVTFVKGNIEGVEEITKVEIVGVYSRAVLTHRVEGVFEWNTTESDTRTVSTESLSENFLLIPQNLETAPCKVKVYVKYSDDATDIMIGYLNKGSWEAGKHYVYTLGDNLPLISVNEDNEVVNEGAFQVYLRAAVTGNWYNESDFIVEPWAYSASVSGWTLRDGYYYYNTPVSPGEKSTSLMPDFEYPTPPSTGLSLKICISVQGSNDPF